MVEESIGKEFLELAIEIERKGHSFYDSVARQSQDRDVRGVFSQLAAREKEHENAFRDMLNRLGGYQPRQEYCREHRQYIRDLADSSIFAGERAQATLAKKTMTDIEAIEIGIGFEKDSILFYSEVRGMVPSQDQQIVDMIVSEEKKHLSELTYVASKLRSGTKLGSSRLQGAT